MTGADDPERTPRRVQVRVRAALACAAFVVALFTPLGPAAIGQAACAAEEGPRAALVVDTGGSVYRLCVRLDAARVSGLHLIELASSQYGLTYRFGEGGQAVCMLANVGATGDDCFGEHPYFWGFWVGDGSGGWTWSGSGAGSMGVSDGGIHGWSWSSGDGPSTHRPPPRTTYASVCPSAPEPDPSRPPGTPDPRGGKGNGGDEGEVRTGTASPGASAAGSGSAGATNRPPLRSRRPGAKGGDEDRRRNKVKKERKRDEVEPSLGPSATPTPAVEAGPPLPEAPGGSGPPPAGVAALGASAALAGAGVIIARRRRTSAR